MTSCASMRAKAPSIRHDWSAFLLKERAHPPRWNDARDLAKELGLKCRHQNFHRDPGPQWRADGVLRTNEKKRVEAASNIFHEMGHWFTSPYRNIPNFGHDSSTEGHTAGPSSWKRVHRNSEALASMMGILLEISTGATAHYTLINHTWWADGYWTNGSPRADTTLKRLRTLGLINRRLEPTWYMVSDR